MCLFGVTLFELTRHAPVPIIERPQAHRKDLEIRNGVWFQPGETREYTGLLLDSYEEGALKSRSVVSNGLLEGLSQGWYTNGQLQVEEHFVTGTSHGVRTKWHPNGQKLSEVTVVKGKLEGTFRHWHENGVLAEEVELTNGEPNGLSKAWFPSGFLKSQVTMLNGKIVEKQFYKDGEYREPISSTPAHLSSN